MYRGLARDFGCINECLPLQRTPESWHCDYTVKNCSSISRSLSKASCIVKNTRLHARARFLRAQQAISLQPLQAISFYWCDDSLRLLSSTLKSQHDYAFWGFCFMLLQLLLLEDHMGKSPMEERRYGEVRQNHTTSSSAEKISPEGSFMPAEARSPSIATTSYGNFAEARRSFTDWLAASFPRRSWVLQFTTLQWTI